MNQKDKSRTPEQTCSDVGDLSESLEDYLEAILVIENERRVARPKEIAESMFVSSPSVTAALQNLANRKLINYAPYDLVTLTDEGRRLALDIKRRHDALLRLFADALQLDPDEADKIACHTEHVMSAEALVRLVEFMDFLDNTHPGGIRLSVGDGPIDGHEPR